MLDNKGFDLWADGYDKAVGLSDEENTYPFAGYREVLGQIYRMIMEKPGAAVLDIGFGTAALTSKLYENGCIIYGQDFSSRMIELASARMPEAHLFQGDIVNGLAVPLLLQRYDFIVATYSLHHLTDEQKRVFIRLALDQLEDKVRKAQADPKLVKNLLTKDFDVRETTSEAWLEFEELNNEAIFDIAEQAPCDAIFLSRLHGG